MNSLLQICSQNTNKIKQIESYLYVNRTYINANIFSISI